MIGPEPDPRTGRGVHLLDLAALVIGYGLASLLVRAFWPSAAAETTTVVAVIGVVYLWLGMAMSGPLVLARRRRQAVRDEPYTRAELAWLIIGSYWIGMTILIVPIRPYPARVVDAGLVGLFPFLAALVLRVLTPRTHAAGAVRWTHRAAIALLVSWPVAWIALILLGKTLL